MGTILTLWFVATTCWQGQVGMDELTSWEVFYTKEAAFDFVAPKDLIITNCSTMVYEGSLTEIEKGE